MTTWTLLLFVIHFGSVQMPGFTSLEACQAADRSITQVLAEQLHHPDIGAADLIIATCVKITK